MDSIPSPKDRRRVLTGAFLNPFSTKKTSFGSSSTSKNVVTSLVMSYLPFQTECTSGMYLMWPIFQVPVFAGETCACPFCGISPSFALPTMPLSRDFVARLQHVVGGQNVLTATEDLIAYSFDGTAAMQQMPGCVLFTTTTEQVVGVLKLANDTKTAVVTRGSGTG